MDPLIKSGSKSLRGDFVSIYQHAESIKNVFQAGYRLPGYKIIILRIFNKYSETLNKEYIERIHQMSYSSLSDDGMLQIFSFLIK